MLRAVFRERERERVFAAGNLAPRASWKQENGDRGSRRGGRIIGFKAGTIEKKRTVGWTFDESRWEST